MSAPIRLHEPVCFDNMQNQFYWIDHFLGDQVKDEWNVSGSGSGVVVDLQAGGIVRLTTGALDTNLQTIAWSNIRTLLASKRVSMECRAKLNSLAQYRVNYQLFYDWSNYIDFRSSHSDNTWYIRAMNGGASTNLDSNIPVTTNYAILRMVCELDGGNHVHYYIDGVQGDNSPITTNVPPDYLQPRYEIYTYEDVAKSFDLDYVVVRQDI